MNRARAESKLGVDSKYEWKDLVAFVMALMETVLLPFVIVVIVLFLLVVVLSRLS